MAIRRILVAGKVQGVGFRYHTQEFAQRHKLIGWVRNLSDGRVEIWAQGPETEVQALVEWAQNGPAHAAVEKVIVETPSEEENLRVVGFQIRRD